MDAQIYASMPERLTMREIEVGGRILVTTLLDAKAASPADIDALYGRRWQVEVDLRAIKAEMGMDILRTQSAAMVDKEIAVHLLAYNLVCALMVRAAAASGACPRTLSFKGTVQLYLAFEQQIRFSAGVELTAMTAQLLEGIAQLRLPVRPGRIEPHAIKRRPKSHQLLTIPRKEARENIRQSRAVSA
jgi:hypothetical protein